MRVKEEMIKKTEEVPRELTKVGVYTKVTGYIHFLPGQRFLRIYILPSLHHVHTCT